MRLTLVLLASCLLAHARFTTVRADEEFDRLSIVEKWRIIHQALNATAANLVKQALPLLVRSTDEVDISDECRSGILQVLNGAKSLQTWAFKFLDSFGKPAGGILTGTFSSFGAYDQCLAIKVPEEEDPSKTQFQGKYCTLELRPPLPPKPSYYNVHHRLKALENVSTDDSVMKEVLKTGFIFYTLALRFGMCVPSTCSIEDIRGIGTVVGGMLHFDATVPRCEVEEPMTLTLPQIIVICVVCVWIAVILLATTFEVIFCDFLDKKEEKKKAKEGRMVQVVTSLSVYSGIPRLFQTNSRVEFKIFHGIKFMSMLWLIVGSVFLQINYQTLQQLTQAQQYSSVFMFQCIINSSLALDSLFFVSAFLTGYAISNRMRDTKWIYGKLLLHRLWRWTPMLMFMVGLGIVEPLTTTGPMAKETFGPLYENCVDNWWANLFYINNIVIRAKNRCLPNSWFLSCELQLFIIGFIFTKMWSSSKKKLGIILTCLACLLSVVVTGIVTAYFQFPPAVLFSQVDSSTRTVFEDVIQHKPYSHLSTWLIGLAFGYYSVKRSKASLKWYVWLSGWCAWFISINAVTFGIYEWNTYERNDVAASALYSAAHRGVWALALAWLTFVCINGKIKAVTAFLSWKAFVPLSRITMWAYLIYPFMLQIVMAHVRDRLQSSGFMALFLFSGFMIFSYFLSSIFYLLVELPLTRLETLVCDWYLTSCPATNQCNSDEKKTNVATTSCNGPPTVAGRPKLRQQESQQPLATEEVLSQLEYDNSGFDNSGFDNKA